MPKYNANRNSTQIERSVARAERVDRFGDHVVNDIPGQRVHAEDVEDAEPPALHVGRPNEEGIHEERESGGEPEVGVRPGALAHGPEVDGARGRPEGRLDQESREAGSLDRVEDRVEAGERVAEDREDRAPLHERPDRVRRGPCRARGRRRTSRRGSESPRT